jgi:hypothetical protein
MKKIFVVLLINFCMFIALQSCKKDKENVDANQALYAETIASGYQYYRNGDILSGVSPSPHGSFKLRFNSVAFAALDSTGELPVGGSFPNGSIIVKEILNGSNINLYAVMKKDPSNENAGSGWVWAEYNTSGSTVYGIGEKGGGCISCHSGSGNRDLVMTFHLH